MDTARRPRLLTPLCAAILLLAALATNTAYAQESDAEKCAALIAQTGRGGVGQVVSVQRGDGRLILTGVEHSNDPSHPQFNALTTLFWETRPTIVFYEGEGRSAAMRTPRQAVVASGEPGLLRYLAQQAGVPASSLEPERSDVHRALLRSFSSEQVQMFILLRRVRYLSVERNVPWQGLGGWVNAHIDDEFRPNSGVDWPIRSFANLEAAFARTWPDRSIRDLPRSWFDPTLPSATTGSLFLNDVNAAESGFRNRQFYHRLAEALLAGHRVFAAVGAGHIASLDTALACLASQEAPEAPSPI